MMNEGLSCYNTAFQFESNLKSVCELLSALCTATSENLAAVLCCHSLTETVFHLSVALLGLVSSFHCVNLLFDFEFIKRDILQE